MEGSFGPKKLKYVFLLQEPICTFKGSGAARCTKSRRSILASSFGKKGVPLTNDLVRLC